MRPMMGYPTSHGNQRTSVFPHQGPAVYVSVVEGVAPALSTGGDTVNARGPAGMKFFDAVWPAGLSDSGTYRVEVLQDAVSGVVGSSSPSQGQPAPTVRLRWVVVATGAQVAAEEDLSAEIVKLCAWGPK